jgi:hypothetical protein
MIYVKSAGCGGGLTVDEAKARLAVNPYWATRALVRLYQQQTAEEQTAESTIDRNGRGFNTADAKLLSSFAQQLLEGRSLSEKQMKIAFARLPKYAAQLLELGRESAR